MTTLDTWENLFLPGEMWKYRIHDSISGYSDLYLQITENSPTKFCWDSFSEFRG